MMIKIQFDQAAIGELEAAAVKIGNSFGVYDQKRQTLFLGDNRLHTYFTKEATKNEILLLVIDRKDKSVKITAPTSMFDASNEGYKVFIDRLRGTLNFYGITIND